MILSDHFINNLTYQIMHNPGCTYFFSIRKLSTAFVLRDKDKKELYICTGDKARQCKDFCVELNVPIQEHTLYKKVNDSDSTYTLEHEVYKTRRLLSDYKTYNTAKEYGELSRYLHELKQKIRSRKSKIFAITYRYKNVLGWFKYSEAELLSFDGKALNDEYTKIGH